MSSFGCVLVKGQQSELGEVSREWRTKSVIQGVSPPLQNPFKRTRFEKQTNPNWSIRAYGQQA